MMKCSLRLDASSVAFNWPRLQIFDGAVAQLGERLICIQEVAGSIPTSSTNNWSALAPRLGAMGL
jgi:hypothetical protein